MDDIRAFPIRSHIVGVASFLPEEEITSAELEAEFGLPPGHIEELTGIRSRRLARTAKPSDLAYQAARACLERCQLEPRDIDAVIYTGVARDLVEPATANIVQHRLEITGGLCFDVSNACLGFVNGLQITDALIARGQARRILVVGAECGWDIREVWRQNRERYDTKDLFVLLTFGHGAAAAVVQACAPDDQTAPGRLVAMEFESQGRHWPLCTWRGHQHPVLTEMVELQRQSLDLLIPAVERCVARAGWRKDDVDVIIPHQPARRPVEKGQDLFGSRRARFCTTFQTCGNMISVTVPATLDHALQSGELRPGQRLILAGVGSGINVGVVAVAW